VEGVVGVRKPRPDDLEAVEVWWLDAHGGTFPTGEWGKLGAKHLSAEVIRTVGLLVNQDKNGIMLCLSYTDQGETDSYIFIPAGCVTEINYLSERE